MDQKSKPKKLYMKIKKKMLWMLTSVTLTSVEYYCGCRHLQYIFSFTSFLFFLIKSYSYNS